MDANLFTKEKTTSLGKYFKFLNISQKHLDLFVVDHVKEWKIYIDDEEKHDGTPNELIQNAQLRIGDLNSGPGEDVKVTVTATKTDGSVVHPLLNYYCRLSKHTKYSRTVKNLNIIFAKKIFWLNHYYM